MTGVFSEKLTSDAITYLDYREISAARSINHVVDNCRKDLSKNQLVTVGHQDRPIHCPESPTSFLKYYLYKSQF